MKLEFNSLRLGFPRRTAFLSWSYSLVESSSVMSLTVVVIGSQLQPTQLILSDWTVLYCGLKWLAGVVTSFTSGHNVFLSALPCVFLCCIPCFLFLFFAYQLIFLAFPLSQPDCWLSQWGFDLSRGTDKDKGCVCLCIHKLTHTHIYGLCYPASVLCHGSPLVSF